MPILGSQIQSNASRPSEPQMPRNTTQASRLRPARCAFARLLDDHLKRGQHAEAAPGRWKPWTNNDFAGVTGVSPNSVANWRNETSAIPPEDILPVLDALFAEKAEFAGRRRELKEAWERAKGLIPEDPDPEPDPADDWLLESRSRTTNLAAITLHQPRRANPAGRYYLDGSVAFAPITLEDREGRTVVAGLRESVVLDIDCAGSGYQIAQASLIGGRAPHDHIAPGVDGIAITGPAANGLLHGDPIGEDHIAIIEPGPAGIGPVAVTLSTLSRAFDFKYSPAADTAPAPAGQTPNRDAILNILFGEAIGRDPASNRILLARATMRRKPQP